MAESQRQAYFYGSYAKKSGGDGRERLLRVRFFGENPLGVVLLRQQDTVFVPFVVRSARNGGIRSGARVGARGA